MEGLVWTLKFIISALAQLFEVLQELLGKGYSRLVEIQELWRKDKAREKSGVASVLGLMP